MVTDFNEFNELMNQRMINELTVKTKSNYITVFTKMSLESAII